MARKRPEIRLNKISKMYNKTNIINKIYHHKNGKRT